MKHVNTLFKQNEDLMDVKTGGIYNYHSVLKRLIVRGMLKLLVRLIKHNMNTKRKVEVQLHIF
jgi:hypothetical protein